MQLGEQKELARGHPGTSRWDDNPGVVAATSLLSGVPPCPVVPRPSQGVTNEHLLSPSREAEDTHFSCHHQTPRTECLDESGSRPGSS